MSSSPTSHWQPPQGSARLHQRSAFTLVEMLTVLMLVTVLIAFTTMGADALRGRSLTRAVDNLTLLFEGARQNALSSGRPTALVVLTNAAPEADGRAMTLMEYTVANGWKQIRPWSFLPDGCCLEVGINASENTFLSQHDPVQGLPDADLSPVSYLNNTVPHDGYAYRVFLPKGGVLTSSGAPIRLRVLEGEVKNGAAQPRNNTAFAISVIAATGRIKVDLPESP